MKFLILLCLIAAVFCSEYSYVGKQACYNQCEHLYKGETQRRCFDKCSALPNADVQEFPKKELCLMGCKLLKKDWQKQLCEVACNQIKADSEFFMPELKAFGKKMFKKIQKKVQMIAPSPKADEFPKKEICLMGCKLLKKDWERQLCEIACNQIKADSEFKMPKFKKIMKQGLKLGKEFVKSKFGIAMADEFPKKEVCLMGCKLLKKDWQKQLCEIACNQIKVDLDPFDPRPKPQPTPCETCKATCIRNQNAIGQCIEKCEQTACKLTPSDLCKQRCIAQQFEVTKCMSKC